MTRKQLFLPIILILIAILAACSAPTGGGSDPDPNPNPNPDPDPVTGTLTIPLPGGVSPSMRLASASDIDSYQVRITCTALSYDETYTGTPGSTLTIESLSAGSYEVYAEAHDTDLAPADTVIFTGSATVSVTAGATATAVITLVPGFGDISVEITIPDDYTPPVTRVKSYGDMSIGGISYTYNADGVIIRYDYEYNQSYVTFDLNGSGQRISGTEYQWDTDTSAYVETGRTITITSDAYGNEEVYSEYYSGTFSSSKTAEYDSTYSYITQLTQRTGVDEDIYRIYRFDEQHRLVEEYAPAGIDLQVWFGGCKYVSDTTESSSVQYEYFENTNIPDKINILIGGILEYYIDFEISSSGLYKGAVAYDKNDEMLGVLFYSSPYIVDDYYLQSVQCFDRVSYDPIEFYGSDFVKAISLDFKDCTELSWIKVYEDGDVFDGMIPENPYLMF